MEVTSAEEDQQIEMTSAGEHTESGVRMQIEGTSATEHTGPFSLQMDPVIKQTIATENTEIEVTSDSESMESCFKFSPERRQIEGTSAATEIMESGERTQWPTNSIFRAPAHIRSGRESNFEPKLVSIGPYYHGRQNLQPMEDLKLRCMPEIRENNGVCLRKTNHPRLSESGIPRCHRSIYNVPVEPSRQGEMGINDVPIGPFMSLEGRARAYYKHEVNYNPHEFVRMLVLDSFFIIRTIFSLSQQVQESMAFLDVHIKEVRSDLLLLENQIPLFFIRKVYKWLFPRIEHPKVPPFETVLEPFICLDMPWTINHGGMKSSIGAAHFLDLYWICSLSPPMYMKLISEQKGDISEVERDRSEREQPSWAEIHLSYNGPMEIANATELHKMAGVEFEKVKDNGHLDVIFSNGIMRMPRLKIDTRQTTLLLNVIAFENCILPTMRIFSCYMKLMDALIDSENDVKLLQQCGVIYNTLSNHEMAATFFNDIGNICIIDNNTNPFSGLYKDVLKYYDSSWHRRCASLRQNYFSSPWAGISVVAGVTLLILSALQTFYTIYGYYHQMNGRNESL